jgi:hypothetical protein
MAHERHASEGFLLFLCGLVQTPRWAMRRGRKIVKVAKVRRFGVRLYWMWHRGWDYEQLAR